VSRSRVTSLVLVLFTPTLALVKVNTYYEADRHMECYVLEFKPCTKYAEPNCNVDYNHKMSLICGVIADKKDAFFDELHIPKRSGYHPSPDNNRFVISYMSDFLGKKTIIERPT
jgi:hypothetical protein